MLADVQEDSKGVNDKKSKGLRLVLFTEQYIFFHFAHCKYNRNNDDFTVQFYPTDTCPAYQHSLCVLVNVIFAYELFRLGSLSSVERSVFCVSGKCWIIIVMISMSS